MANVKIESDDDSLSDDSLEVSDTVTGVTNLTSDTILDSPDKISCALCVTRTKGNKHQQGKQESGQQCPLLRKLFDNSKYFSCDSILKIPLLTAYLVVNSLL